MTRGDPIGRRWRRAWIACAALSVIALTLAVVCEIQLAEVALARKTGSAIALQRYDAALDAWRTEQQLRPLRVEVGPDQPGRSMNRAELEARLFPGGAPATRPAMSPNTVVWPDAARGFVWMITFRPDDGTWASISQGPLPPPLVPEPWLWTLRREIEPARRLLFGARTPLAVVPIFWLALLIATRFRSRHRRNLAHATLLVAWLCVLGWLLAYGRWILMPGSLMRNQMLRYGAGMMLVSAGTFVAVRRIERPRDPSRCAACGYDLTGNVSGVCPECGTSTGTAALEPSPLRAPAAMDGAEGGP